MKLGRKMSGGKYHSSKKKKLRERKAQARVVKIGDKKIKKIRTLGGSQKVVSLSQNYANITSSGKTKKVKIINVLETPSNRFLARQNILTKGAIIETEIGNARITNRPGQEGIVQAQIIEKKD